jgi:hypothetical protein
MVLLETFSGKNLKKIFHKKAQTEIIGLVIIVIILSFALIFGLQFLNKEDNKLQERYLQLNADNLRNAILKTNICKGITIKDEIVNCENNIVSCLENCQKLDDKIKEIVSLSVKNDYEFYINDKKIKDKGCLNKDTLTSSTQPIALSEIKVSLKLC